MIALPQPLDREEWADLPGRDGYQVSSLGRVRTQWRGGRHRRRYDEYHQNKITPAGKGYVVAQAGRPKQELVHRLVLLAFVGPPPEGKDCVRHLNGTRDDNTVNNLCWATRVENESDKLRHGTLLRGEAAPWSLLTDEGVRDIVRRAKAGETSRDMAPSFGVAPVTVECVLKGKSWCHVTGFEQKARPQRSRRLVRCS